MKDVFLCIAVFYLFPKDVLVQANLRHQLQPFFSSHVFEKYTDVSAYIPCCPHLSV